MAPFLKFKFPISLLKSNFNGGQFYKNILNFGYFKKIVNLALKQSLKWEIK